MPATEKTWRDQAKMHVLFGISALVMLIATIWMLAKDHNREWRRWQLDDRAREGWTIQAQLAQAKADSAVALDRLQKDLWASRSTKIDASLVEDFKTKAQREDDRLEGKLKTRADFKNLDDAVGKLQQAENGTDGAMRARQDVL